MSDHPSNGWERPKQAGWEFRVWVLGPWVSWERRNGKENGNSFRVQGLGLELMNSNYYDGYFIGTTIKIHSFIPS